MEPILSKTKIRIAAWSVSQHTLKHAVPVRIVVTNNKEKSKEKEIGSSQHTKY
jgi:hypothetical protein